jgi:hypothetical protein
MCADVFGPHLASAGSERTLSVCGIPDRAIQYSPFVGRPAHDKTKLTEMSLAKGSVAEAALDNQQSFPIQEIIVNHSGIIVGKARQFQVMPFSWLGQWPDSGTYGYRTWRHENIFTNVIRTYCSGRFGHGLQNSRIKPRIFCLPDSQIQSGLFADISVNDLKTERLPENRLADDQSSWDDPSPSVIDHRIPANLVAIYDQGCLPISDFPTIDNQFIGRVHQAPGLIRSEGCRDKSKDENNKVRPIEGVVLFGCGAFLGIMGIFLAVIIAPVRGNVWGFAGLALIPVGLTICYFSGGFSIVHLAPP